MTTTYKAANGSTWSLEGNLVTIETTKGTIRYGLVTNGHAMKPEAQIYAAWSIVTLVTRIGQTNQNVLVGTSLANRAAAEKLLADTLTEARSSQIFVKEIA